MKGQRWDHWFVQSSLSVEKRIDRTHTEFTGFSAEIDEFY